MMSKKQIFISWAKFQRRNVSMASYFGFELVFIGSDSTRRRLLVEYVKKFFATLFTLFRQSPDVVWIQLPPLPALTAAYIYKLFCFRKIVLIGDCHNSMLRRPWSGLPSAIWHLNRCDVVLVHNTEQQEVARALGVIRPVEILEDAPASIQVQASLVPQADSRPKILFPASFSEDEPIAEVFKAARALPEMQFFITGNTQRAVGRHDLSQTPDNVTLTGFLSISEFDALFSSSDVILGFTKFEGIQLSVCNEAVGVGKPMVLSGTTILKKLFYKGAVFVDSSCHESIANGCRQAVDQRAHLASEVKELCKERNMSWRTLQAEPLRCNYIGE